VLDTPFKSLKGVQQDLLFTARKAFIRDMTNRAMLRSPSLVQQDYEWNEYSRVDTLCAKIELDVNIIANQMGESSF
jgi:hypothetical protein